MMPRQEQVGRRAPALLLAVTVVLAPAANGATARTAVRCGGETINFGRNPTWSPDGRRIAFECTGICVMDPDGTRKATLMEGPDESTDRQPAWSPDGKKIAFVRQMRSSYLYVMNADGTGATRLAAGAGQPWSPAWSPDGKKIAFTEDQGNGGTLYVINAGGGGPVQVAAHVGRNARPAWSPDGARIAFPDSHGGLSVVGADGKTQTVLTTLSADDPAWSADGKIAFASRHDGHLAVFVVNADGGAPAPLTTEGDNNEPAWSPDGRKIAFTSERDGIPTTFVMNADGSNQNRLFSLPVALTGLAWSPEGRSIAFAVLGRYGVDGIYVIGDDGSRQRRLTTGPDIRDTNPAWSPDGQKIAFIRVHNKGSSRVYLMNTDGSRLSELTSDGESAAWLPGGRTIAFKAFGDGSRPILTIKADGTEPATLIKTFDAFAHPVFSPDGQRIAFVKFGDGAYGVHLMRSDGNGETTLGPRASGSLSAWSPDGPQIAFAHPETDARCGGIDVMNADGSQPITLSSDSDSSPAWSPDGKRIAFVSKRDGYDALYIMNADGSRPTRITKDFR